MIKTPDYRIERLNGTWIVFRNRDDNACTKILKAADEAASNRAIACYTRACDY
jgi:hypothetical protein